MFKEGYDASSQQQDDAAAESNDLSSQVQADQIQARRDVTKTPALTDLATDAGAQAAKESDYLNLASIYRPAIETSMKLGEQTVASNPFASNFDATSVYRKPQQTARNYYDKT